MSRHGDPVTYPRFRLRIWVERRLVDERWVSTVDEASAAYEDHADIAERAVEAGETFMVEVYDPAASEGRCAVRFGTDPSLMVDPVRTYGVEDTMRRMRGWCDCPECRDGHA